MRCLGLLVLISTLVLAQGPPVSPGAGAGPALPSPTQPPAPKFSPDLKIPDFKSKIPDLKFQGGSPSENTEAGRQLNVPGLKFEAAPPLGRRMLLGPFVNERPQANPLRCAIPLLEMEPPEALFIPKAVLPASAVNDRIATPPPAPACPQ
jgi:hypothetical protein